MQENSALISSFARYYRNFKKKSIVHYPIFLYIPCINLSNFWSIYRRHPVFISMNLSFYEPKLVYGITYLVIFSDSLQNIFHAFQFCTSTYNGVFFNSCLMKTRGTIATIQDFFVSTFKKAI